MSKDSYAQYLIREEERKRLEKERLKRLEEERRRQEEIQKKKAELERREEIRSEKERLAVISSLRALGSSLQQRKETIPKDIPQPSGKEELSHKMWEMMEAIDVQLQAFRASIGLVFAPQLEEIKQKVTEIKQDNCDPFYYQSLKWLQRDLNCLVATAPQVMEDLWREAKKAKGEIDELVVKLRVVNASSILTSQRERAERLISNLETLAREKNPRKIVSDLPQLGSKAQCLWDDFVKVVERDQARAFVLQNVRQILEEMGYQALDIETNSENAALANGHDSLSLLFRTPESGAVQLSCGLDNSLHAEFVNLKCAGGARREKEISVIDTVYRCEKWCQDYDHLQNELARRDILMREHWRIAPTEEDYQEVLVPAEFITGELGVVPPAIIAKERG